MSRTCPGCGSAVSETAKFCRSCGSAVPAAPPAPPAAETGPCPGCGTALVAGALFCHRCGAEAPPPARIDCPQCGQEIDGTDLFCRYCGASTQASPMEAPPASVSVPEPQAELTPAPVPEPCSALEPAAEPEWSFEAPESEAALDEAEPQAAALVMELAALPIPALETNGAIPAHNLPEPAEEPAPALAMVAPPPLEPVLDLGATDEEATSISPLTLESAEPARACPVCQGQISAAARFCRVCGSSLAELEPTVAMRIPQLGEAPEPPTALMVSVAPTEPEPEVARTCPACSQPVEEWAQFCRHCGTTLISAPADSSTCVVCGAVADEGSELCPQCAQTVGSGRA